MSLSRFAVGATVVDWSDGFRGGCGIRPELSEQARAHSRLGTRGSSDVLARLIAQGLTVSLGQPVLVDNRAPVLSG